MVTSRIDEDDIQPVAPLLRVLERARQSGQVRLLLDYDGTLVPLAASPELATPDAELFQLLVTVASARGIDLEIVSGRRRGTVNNWFSVLPVTLWAEHGFWYRAAPDGPWEAAATVDVDWQAYVLPTLQQFAHRTPGSHIEVKTASVAWHYRGAERAVGERHADDLRRLLQNALVYQPLEVLDGKKVLEVRCRGISKALVAERTVCDRAVTTVAFGDDRTDEDLFRALPPSSITVAVGQPLRGARYCVDDHRAVRHVLARLSAASSLVGGARTQSNKCEEPISPCAGRRRRRLSRRRVSDIHSIFSW